MRLEYIRRGIRGTCLAGHEWGNWGRGGCSSHLDRDSSHWCKAGNRFPVFVCSRDHTGWECWTDQRCIPVHLEYSLSSSCCRIHLRPRSCREDCLGCRHPAWYGSEGSKPGKPYLQMSCNSGPLSPILLERSDGFGWESNLHSTHCRTWRCGWKVCSKGRLESRGLIEGSILGSTTNIPCFL